MQQNQSKSFNGFTQQEVVSVREVNQSIVRNPDTPETSPSPVNPRLYEVKVIRIYRRNHQKKVSRHQVELSLKKQAAREEVEEFIALEELKKELDAILPPPVHNRVPGLGALTVSHPKK